MEGIDLNRGVLKRIHPSGVAVHMYVDEPGVYYDSHGRPMSEAVAAGCGIDTERWAKLKIKRERMLAAQEAIEHELELAEDRQVVLYERNGFRVMDLGLGRCHVHDPDGGVLTPIPIPRDIADMLMDQLAPRPVEPEPEPEPEPAEHTQTLTLGPKKSG